MCDAVTELQGQLLSTGHNASHIMRRFPTLIRGLSYHHMLTYSQNFEDVMLARLFAKQVDGFYIDVGGWHPEIHSVTKFFYDLGWRGINVEPIRSHWEAFEEARPRDANLNAALSDRAGTARFYECTTDTALSTMDPAQAAELNRRNLPIREYDVPMLTLDRIIEEHSPATIDFLKIDVEGAEAMVLAGVDLSRHRPRVLVIEATKPATPVDDWDRIDDIANWAAWEPKVLSAGYQFAYYDGLSRFYVRDEDAALAQRLRLPPGVYDRIEYPETMLLRQDHAARGELIERLEKNLRVSEADRAARLEVIQRLEAMLQTCEADRAARVGVIDQLKDVMRLRQDHAARGELIERLEQNLRVSEADRAARLEVIQRLDAMLKVCESDRAARLDVINELNERLNSQAAPTPSESSERP